MHKDFRIGFRLFQGALLAICLFVKERQTESQEDMVAR